MSHNTKGWTLFRSDGQVEYFQFNAGTFYTDDEIQVYSGSGNLADGNWHHHVFTYDGSLKAAGCDFWFDGVSQRGIGNFGAGSDTLSGTKSTIDTNVDFMMGASAGGYYLNGAMDNVRIYRRAITADEVTTIYNSEKP
jgi:hypothetical protein